MGRVTKFVEKPPAHEVFTDLANAGILVAEPGILEYIPSGTMFDFGHDLLPDLLTNNIPVCGQPITGDEFLIDIGTTDGLQKAQDLWRKSKPIRL
jgi:NDP-sugar pyrophosphorylase family protein